jgi:Cu+-exporting ATPase
MVYEILNTHDMCDFYTVREKQQTAVPQKPGGVHRNYAYLDDAEVQEKLIEFQQGSTAQVSLYLPQMHCVSCIWLLEHLPKLDSGITHARVNFLKKTVTLQYDQGATSLRKIATLMHTIGYPPDINLQDVDGAKKSGVSRTLAYQLGVAGFAFGNVMLFSFPEYVGMSRETDAWFSMVFGWLSVAIALPVLLFSARDYFISAAQGLRQGKLNIDVPLCLALLSLFGRSIWEIATQTGAGYLDSFCGLTFLLLIGRWFQQRVWHELSFERDFKSYFPVAATVRQGEAETTVPVQRLVPGDVIVVRSHEIIPADGILLKGAAQIDYSFVTGESDPVTIISGDKIFAGGKQTGGSIEIALTRRVAQSHLTKLWNNEAFKSARRGQVTRLADAAGRYFTWLILAFGGGAMLYWWGLHGDAATAINAFTAVMIVACPCNIALSIPFTLGNLVRILGRHRLYLKNSNVLEAFAEVDTVVFDKTGTITYAAGSHLTWKPYTKVGKEVQEDAPLALEEQIALRSVVRHSTHPLSRRLYDFFAEVPVIAPTAFQETAGQGIAAEVAGRRVQVGSAAFVGLSDTDSTVFDLENGIVSGGVWMALDGVVRGRFEVKNRLRTGTESVIAYFRNLAKGRPLGRVFLLSGDQNREAVVLKPLFAEPDAMWFQQSPQDKLDFIRNRQQQGNKVLMLGDGLNDAGALKQSDLGIVISENTNNFTPACDAVLDAAAFERLPQLMEVARSGVRIVQYSYLVAFVYNAIGLSFAVTGQLSPLVAAILMPVSSVSIVLFGTGMGQWVARRKMGIFDLRFKI